MKRVLLVVHTHLFLERMLEAGHVVAGSGDLEPVFHFAYKSTWPEIRADHDRVRALGYLVSADTTRHCEASSSVGSGRGTPIHRFGRLMRDRNLLGQYMFLRARLREIRRLYRTEAADLVGIFTDVPRWDTGTFIRAAELEDIPVAVLFSQAGPQEELLHVCSRDGRLAADRGLNRLLARVQPKWVAERSGKRFLMMPAAQILAREFARAAAPEPWIEGSSRADAVLMENEAYLERARAAGLGAANLRVTGQPYHDVLFAELAGGEQTRQELCRQHGLDPRRPILLTSVLPRYAGRDDDTGSHADYDALVRAWIGYLASFEDYSTLLSLHPAQDRSEFEFAERLGTTVARLPITRLVPHCHLFVTSLSSTISMAIACGKPVVNYDFANYGNTHYGSAAGVLRVTTESAFRDTVQRLLRSPAAYEATAQSQQSDAERWGVLDGQAGNRILVVMRELMEDRR